MGETEEEGTGGEPAPDENGGEDGGSDGGDGGETTGGDEADGA